MTSEAGLLRRLRTLAIDPAARGLNDDVAVLPTMGDQMVLTTDTLVEGVHFRPNDPPETVGWKLAAVNLSDLAGKGARPRGCLLNYTLGDDTSWDTAFLEGFARALTRFGMPLLGGDTVSLPPGAPRVLSVTAIGDVEAGQVVPRRGGAIQGDLLYVTGPVGDAGAGLALLEEGLLSPAELIRAYRVPTPHLTFGQSLAPIAHAMTDISDGLLIDAFRMAEASNVAVQITDIPISEVYEKLYGRTVEARMHAATAGDDYVLLVALGADRKPPHGLFPVGKFHRGEGMTIRLDGKVVRVPERLGYEHG